LFASAVAVGFLVRELLENEPLVAVGWGIVAVVGFVVFLYRDGRIGGRPEQS
jgi:hypothetical protein